MARKQYLTLKEIQAEELKILKNAIRFFNQNKIKYWVYGGTLLGTVRHSGFIPWDDDIDIVLPRPDYERFVKLILDKQSLGLNLHVEAPEIDITTNYPFAKICNFAIKVESKNKIDKELWIDVLPLDGIRGDPRKALKRIGLLQRIYKKKRYEARGIHSKTIPSNIKSLLLHFVPFKIVAKYFIKKCKRVRYSDSIYVCDTVWAVHPGNILQKEWLNKTIKMPFEDIEVNVFGGYKYYLENRYGKNYMEIPPKDKRETHHIKAYRVDK